MPEMSTLEFVDDSHRAEDDIVRVDDACERA